MPSRCDHFLCPVAPVRGSLSPSLLPPPRPVGMANHPRQQRELPPDNPLPSQCLPWAQLCSWFLQEEGEGDRGSSLSFVLPLPPTSAPLAALGDLSPLPWMSLKGSSCG